MKDYEEKREKEDREKKDPEERRKDSCYARKKQIERCLRPVAGKKVVGHVLTIEEATCVRNIGELREQWGPTVFLQCMNMSYAYAY